MRRLFWISLGATAGVLAVRKITKAANSVTPDGAAERVTSGLATLTRTVHDFTDEVRAGMAARDAELRQALGLNDPQATPDLADVAAVFDSTRTNARGTN